MIWEPRIVAFLCNWCSYSAADNAGAAKLPFPPNVYTVRVMCSGRVDCGLLLTTFAEGADGVLVCGCHPGDCHYIDGNMRAYGRFLAMKRMLEELGIEPARAKLTWVGASEAERFCTVAREMTEQIRGLGPLAWRTRRSSLRAADAVGGQG